MQTKEEKVDGENNLQRGNAIGDDESANISPLKSQSEGSETIVAAENGLNKANHSARCLLKSASISASQCINVKPRRDVTVSIHFTN